MIAYYEDQVARSVALQHAGSWLGTPFRKGGAVRGAGVDCVHLVLAIWDASGFRPALAVPAHYSLDAGAHSGTSQVLALADGCARLQALWRRTPGDESCRVAGLTGDLLVFAPDRQCAHHVGMLLGGMAGEFVHAWRDTGVVVGELRDLTFARILVAIYRPLAAAREDA